MLINHRYKIIMKEGIDLKHADWSYLCGVPQDYEADIIIGLLDEHNIPAVKRYPGAGEFLKTAYGITSGVDIYVPPGQLEFAQTLLNEKPSEVINCPEEFEADHQDLSELQNLIEENTSEENDYSNSSWRVWGTILILLVLMLAIATQKHLF